MKITITDDYGNTKEVNDPELVDGDGKDITLFDFICQHISPCGGCGNQVLSHLTDEEDGWCYLCVEKEDRESGGGA